MNHLFQRGKKKIGYQHLAIQGRLRIPRPERTTLKVRGTDVYETGRRNKEHWSLFYSDVKEGADRDQNRQCTGISFLILPETKNKPMKGTQNPIFFVHLICSFSHSKDNEARTGCHLCCSRTSCCIYSVKKPAVPTRVSNPHRSERNGSAGPFKNLSSKECS